MSMKATGIVRKIDELGRLVLPKELRDTHNIKRNVPLEIFVDDDKIILVPYQPTCIFCHSSEDLVEFNDKKVCKACISSLDAKVQE